MARHLVWFRQDLRLEDHAALAAATSAAETGAVYIWNPSEGGRWSRGGASRWWLHHSLRGLAERLKELNIGLHVVTTDDTEVALLKLMDEYAVDRVFWLRSYEPWAVQRDERLKSKLQERAKSFPGNLIHEPWEVLKSDRTPYKVFTPYYRAHSAIPLPPLAPMPERAQKDFLGPTPLVDLLPTIPWDQGFVGRPGLPSWQDFFSTKRLNYAEHRNRPDLQGTSMLSPHLHFGEVSPRQLAHAYLNAGGGLQDQWMKEIGWREFAYSMMFYFPATIDSPLREEFARFPWVDDDASLERWQKGATGYPIVDAGMRELWTTGRMHNRVRMIVASFLTKHLRQSWLRGAEWFWDTLTDADLAANTLGWQWAAGCGADAAPYFRIFNPILQGQKFDPEGLYVRRWCPEYRDVPLEFLHSPWDFNSQFVPMIEHAAGRQAALSALKSIS